MLISPHFQGAQNPSAKYAKALWHTAQTLRTHVETLPTDTNEHAQQKIPLLDARATARARRNPRARAGRCACGVAYEKHAQT